MPPAPLALQVPVPAVPTIVPVKPIVFWEEQSNWFRPGVYSCNFAGWLLFTESLIAGQGPLFVDVKRKKSQNHLLWSAGRDHVGSI